MLLGVVLIVQAAAALIPGDATQFILGAAGNEEARQELRHELGLDRPFFERYVSYVTGVAHGDFGRSYRTRRPVLEEIGGALPGTLRLGGVALVLAVILGIPLGTLSALRRNSIVDYLATVVSLFGMSMPIFWTGLLAIYVFAFRLPLFPTGGDDRGVLSYVLPGFTLCLFTVGPIARMTRTSLLEVLSEDYIRTARAKGLTQLVVVARHALRPAFIPVLTTIGLQAGVIIGGAVVTETVFSWPGMGRLIVTSILARDFLVVQGAVAILAAVFILLNLLTDLLYPVVDPRIRLA